MVAIIKAVVIVACIFILGVLLINPKRKRDNGDKDNDDSFKDPPAFAV